MAQKAASEQELLVWVKERNVAMAGGFEAELKKKKLSAARRKAIEKAVANNFFLGLNSQWYVEDSE